MGNFEQMTMFSPPSVVVVKGSIFPSDKKRRSSHRGHERKREEGDENESKGKRAQHTGNSKRVGTVCRLENWRIPRKVSGRCCTITAVGALQALGMT